MPKRPTPKKRRAKSKGRNQYSIYVKRELKRLIDRQKSPFAVQAFSKKKEKKALEGITRVKA